MKGRVLIKGVKYWLSAWTKKDQNGDKYLSLAISEYQPTKNISSVQQKINDDDIPF